MLCLIIKLCAALCLVTSLEASVSVRIGGGSRSILRAIDDGKKDKEKVKDKDYAVELNATNFDAVLRETPATYSIVEFFAHWCPACRNYKPHYEKVARLFNGADAIHPGIIFMTRVDCALKVSNLSGYPSADPSCVSVRLGVKNRTGSSLILAQINNDLCDKFSVGHYPMLFWGKSSKFVSASWQPKKENSDINVIDNFRTADRLLNWINKQLGSSYNLDDEKYENEHLQTNISDPGQIARAVYDVEEATATAFDIILEHKMIKSETRASLIKFLQILVAHHPSRRCRKGSAEMLVDFDILYSSKISSASKIQLVGGGKNGAVGNLQICGKEVPRGYWIFCRGSKNETRGFSCGLWVLLHSLSVRIDDGESQTTFRATCDFIHDFFVCEECRQHFYEMCSSVPKPFEKARDYVLWLWEAHNKVNERLMKEEASLETGDPKFPKIIWPPKQLCSSCYLDQKPKSKEISKINWNRDEVYKFLTGYYGETLITLYKDKELLGNSGTDKAAEDLITTATNAIVVPVGAALAIAVASCAFGALACCWRSLQKNRKPRRSWN